MHENPDFTYDVNGRHCILERLVLCGQREDGKRLAMSSPVWMVWHTLMMTTASLDLVQVIEDTPEATHSETLEAMRQPMRILGALLGGPTFRSLREYSLNTLSAARPDVWQ